MKDAIWGAVGPVLMAGLLLTFVLPPVGLFILGFFLPVIAALGVLIVPITWLYSAAASLFQR